MNGTIHRSLSFIVAAAVACGEPSGAGTPDLSNAPVARVAVTPNVVSLSRSGTQQLQVTVFEAKGHQLTGRSVSFSTNAPNIATVSSTGLVTAVANGQALVTATAGGVTTPVTVLVGTVPAPTGTITLQPQQSFQTIVGWEGHNQIGQLECNPTAYQAYKEPLQDRIVNELGINRVRLEIRSDTENPVDHFARFRAGTIDYKTWRTTWFVPVNDNADPATINPAGFQWSNLDYDVEQSVIPLRTRLAARGEKLYVNLNYVDFQASTSFEQMRDPKEYAELMLATFQHLQQRYGFVPDAVELVLEPDNTPWRAPDLARALVATGDRLKAAGFTPDFIAPSNTSMSAALTYFDAMVQTPRVLEYLTELAYHRYSGVSDPTLALIGQRAKQYGIRTSMLEHIGSGFEDLFKDLTVGNVSAWQQFALAYCGSQDNPDGGGIYYQVNQAVPSAPRVNISNRSKMLRQVFLFVRAGAVRYGASSTSGAFQPMAFRNVDGKHVVVVKASSGGAFSVAGLPADTYGIKYATANAWDQNPVDVTIAAGGTMTAHIPAPGVLTVYRR